MGRRARRTQHQHKKAGDMGAEMTKWLIDSKVEDIHKKMPWRDGDDDGRKEQQQADSVVDDLSQMFGSRSEEEVEQATERKETEAALKKSRKVAASLRSKYKLGESLPKTEEQRQDEKKKTQEKLEQSRSLRDKMRSKYQRG